MLPRKLILGALLGVLSCSTSSSGESSAGFAHPGGTIQGNQTWTAGTHTVSGSITVTNGTLTIDAGATVIMETTGTPYSITIGKDAALAVNGTALSPVVFTSGSPTPNRGDWGTIEFQSGSLSTNVIQNANFSYGGGTLSTSAAGTILVDAGATATITSTAVSNSAGFGVVAQAAASSGTAEATLVNFSGNTLVHNALGPISVSANTAGALLAGVYGPNDVDGIDVVISQLLQDATWPSLGTPWILEGLTVETLTGTATLTIAAGNTILMASGTSLVVQKNGGLILAGTAEKPITVTSAQSSPARGDWYEIDYYSNSLTTNSIEYTVVEYGGGDQKGSIWLEQYAHLSVDNLTLTNSADVGLYVNSLASLDGFTNNTVTRNASWAISIDADLVRQIQDPSNSLSGNDTDGVYILNDLLATSATWSALDVFYVFDSAQEVSIADPQDTGITTLTIGPGVTIKFGENIVLEIEHSGALMVNGTADQPVLMTALDIAAGWYGVRVASDNGSTLNYTKLDYAGNSGDGGLICLGDLTTNYLTIPEVKGSTCDTLDCSKYGGLDNPGLTMNNNSCGDGSYSSGCIFDVCDPNDHCSSQ